jgi:hypothetical protein
MDPIGPGLFGGADFVGKLGEVGGEDGRGEEDFRHGVME